LNRNHWRDKLLAAKEGRVLSGNGAVVTGELDDRQKGIVFDVEIELALVE
jgi:hypothetical protein